MIYQDLTERLIVFNMIFVSDIVSLMLIYDHPYQNSYSSVLDSSAMQFVDTHPKFDTHAWFIKYN